jgi:hypothetical protein
LPDKKIKLEKLMLRAPEVAMEFGRLTLESDGMPFVVKKEYEIFFDEKGNEYVIFNGKKINLRKIYQQKMKG